MRSRAARAAAALAVLAGAPFGVAASREPAAPADGPFYVDVAPRSRFDYRSNNDFTGRKYFPQPMCGGVALLDYDGDGRLDVFLTNGAKLPELTKTDRSFHNCLLRGRPDGTYEDVTAAARLAGADLDFSFGVAAGDYDNDGHTDLFLCQAGGNALYHNEGDGTFRDVTQKAGLEKPKDLLSVCAAWVDTDGDGLLDLVVSHYTYWSPAADLRCSIAEAGEIYCSPRKYRSVPHSLYRNLGGGRFEDVSRASGFAAASNGKGMGIAVADVNGDDRMDVFVANDTEPNFLYVNQGGGRFVEQASQWGVDYNDRGETVSGMGADAKDYDNDGHVDVFYNNLQMQVWGLFQNEGGRRFGYVSPSTGILNLSRRFSGWSNAFVDYDNDGWKDIYSANGDVDYLPVNGEQRDTMLRNRDGRSFEDVSERLGPDFVPLGFQRGSAVGDVNGDGFPDLVVTSLGRRPRILVSRGANGNHWLVVDPRGRASNRDGIGCKVKLTTASGRTLYNHATTSVGFMSSSDRRVHFGLGREAAVRSLELRWPSGRVQTLADVPVDRVLVVEEPE